MTTHTLTTTTGQRIDVSCWTGNGLNFQIHIDGDLYTDGTSIIGPGDTEESEAEHQAKQTAKELKEGRIRRLDGAWVYVEDRWIERGKALQSALATTDRDTWEDDGAPEQATTDSSWDFDGWGRIRLDLSAKRAARIGGDWYVLPTTKGGR